MEEKIVLLKTTITSISSIEDKIKIIDSYLSYLPKGKELVKLLTLTPSVRKKASYLQKKFNTTTSVVERKSIFDEYQSLYLTSTVDDIIFLRYLQNWKMREENINESLNKEELIKSMISENMTYRDILYITKKCKTTMSVVMRVVDKLDGRICVNKNNI